MKKYDVLLRKNINDNGFIEVIKANSGKDAERKIKEKYGKEYFYYVSEIHQEESEKQYKCIMCGDKFKTQEELSKHQHLFCTGGW